MSTITMRSLSGSRAAPATPSRGPTRRAVRQTATVPPRTRFPFVGAVACWRSSRALIRVWTDATDDASWPYGKAFSDRMTQDAVRHHGSLVQITVHADPTWLSARVGHAPGNRRHLPVCAG